MTQEQLWQIAVWATMKREAQKIVRAQLKAEGRLRLWEVNLRLLARDYIEKNHVLLRAMAELAVANGPPEWRRDYVAPPRTRRRNRPAGSTDVRQTGAETV